MKRRGSPVRCTEGRSRRRGRSGREQKLEDGELENETCKNRGQKAKIHDDKCDDEKGCWLEGILARGCKKMRVDTSISCDEGA